MLFGAFRPQTTREIKKVTASERTRPFLGVPWRDLLCAFPSNNSRRKHCHSTNPISLVHVLFHAFSQFRRPEGHLPANLDSSDSQPSPSTSSGQALRSWVVCQHAESLARPILNKFYGPTKVVPWLLADSGCRNTREFCRVGSEEVLQSLRTASRNGTNCIGNAASPFTAPSFSGSKVSPKMRQMIERVRINVASHGLGPLLIRDGDIPYRTLKRGRSVCRLSSFTVGVAAIRSYRACGRRLWISQQRSRDTRHVLCAYQRDCGAPVAPWQ